MNREWLSNKEKSILLSAIAREKKICIEVDKELSSQEPNEKSLESICNELDYKFCYDRLFKQIEKQVKEETIDILIAECERYKNQYKTFYFQDLLNISKIIKA